MKPLVVIEFAKEMLAKYAMIPAEYEIDAENRPILASQLVDCMDYGLCWHYTQYLKRYELDQDPFFAPYLNKIFRRMPFQELAFPFDIAGDPIHCDYFLESALFKCHLNPKRIEFLHALASHGA